MLSTISWKVFLLILVIIVSGYYLIILLLFYRKEFRNLFKHETTVQNSDRSNHFSAVKTNEDSDPHSSRMSYSDFMVDHDEDSRVQSDLNPEQINSQVHELLDELKSILTDFKMTRPNKDEIIAGIGDLVQKYSGLSHTSILAELNQHIIQECKTHCSITLSDADTKMLWNS